MFDRISKRRIAIGLGALVWLVSGTFSSVQANHTTVCNNDATGIDEISVEWNNVVFAGVDLGVGGLGNEGRAVCIDVAGTPVVVYTDMPDPDPTKVGRVVTVTVCTNSGCPATKVDWTGAEVNTTAPLFSCVWVNGSQQIPGCPTP